MGNSEENRRAKREVRAIQKKYRPNVAALVLSPDGQILLCERSDVAGAWQPPQGGIDPGETDEVALFRELEEEIGKHDIEIVSKMAERLQYDWPEKLWRDGFVGQEQVYFLMQKNCDSKIVLNEEFANFRWVEPKEFRLMVSGFKKSVYIKALEYFLESEKKSFFSSKA